ncbi:hypothetical protein NXW76_00825 [Bacteroides thetaiotaomicron]|nr:hypothetical protein [Bacteroides thetaiotaomicron]
MNEKINIKKLKSSWTKYDIVKLIDITADNDLEPYIVGLKAIDTPVLKGFLGINHLSDELPSFWKEIQNYPKQVRLFAFVAAGIYALFFAQIISSIFFKIIHDWHLQI